MAGTIQRLKLFLSCTSELEVERKLFRDVIAEVNQVVEDSHGVTVRLVDWHWDIVPGVGTDPQQVINVQTTDYQIYVGLLGTRFGTPTSRAGSGTEDEFNIAYSRFRSDPTSIRLLLYFRIGLSGSVYSVDPEQLRRVQEFRERLASEKGVLFSEFASPEEFLKLSRTHLIQLVATQWGGSTWKPVPGLEPIAPKDVQLLLETHPETGDANELEESGLLDLRVETDESFAAAMAALGQISQLMSRSAQEDREWKLEGDKLLESGARNPRKVQEFVNLKAQDFCERARQLRPLTAAFKAASDEFFESLSQLIILQLKSGSSTPKEMMDGLKTFAETDDAARTARDTYAGIVTVLSGLPALTREFKRHQRNLILQIEQLNAAIAAWLDRSAALLSRVSEAIKNPPASE